MSSALRVFLISICVVSLLTLDGCARQNVPVPTAPGSIVSDNSYVDLEPGAKLRIVVPLLKSGGYKPAIKAQHTEGNALYFSAKDLIGYESSQYSVTGKRDGAVRLEFVSAESTRDGKTIEEASAPDLPFGLPRRRARIRLIYLVRVSEADHNMAIVAARRLDLLNAFTKRLQANLTSCEDEGELFCSWVPAGIAVRPEEK